MRLFPGILRDLVGLDFPITVNTDVMIPDQAAMIKHYKGRLKKMQAAQRDSHGGYRIDAQVAQRQLIETLENLISSSLKTCRTSVVIGVRTSQPVQSYRDLAEQERVLSDRRQKVLYTVMQLNGSRGLPEDLAKRRLFVGGLPGMSEEKSAGERLPHSPCGGPAARGNILARHATVAADPMHRLPWQVGASETRIDFAHDRAHNPYCSTRDQGRRAVAV
jgi:hypothetical protein